MGNVENPFLSDEIKELFSGANVIIFTCRASRDFPLVYISRNSEEILGFEPSYFIDKSDKWASRIHPDDREQVIDHFLKVINNGGEATNEYRFKTKEGSYIWLRVEIKRIENPETGGHLIYGSATDITDLKKAERALEKKKTGLQGEIEKRKKVEQRLQKRLSYEKALSRCSNLLLESTTAEALLKSLDILLDATSTDRVYLYKNLEENGELYLDLVAEATAEGVEPVADNQGDNFKYSDVPWWHNNLSNQQIINAQIDEIPEPERSILVDQSVKSVLVIPLTVNQEWYGYLGFADTRQQRTWKENEISLLKTASGIIAAFEKRKMIEKSLVQQRNYTETILDSLPSIYLLMDEDFNFVQWNRNAELYTEYGNDELNEKNAFDLIVPEDHEELKRATQRVISGEGEGAELRLLTKSGKEIHYYWKGYYITLDNQKYFLCVGLDITQQKETEKKLLDEKRFNEALIESLPGVFYMLDGDQKFIRWNKNFEKEFGYTADEIKGMATADFISQTDYPSVQRKFEAVFEKGQSEIEIPVVAKDGEKIPYYLTGKKFVRDDEEFLVGVGHDISEQKKAREQLKKSEELFRNLFLNAPAAIVMVNPDNKIQSINKAFQEMFGYSEQELLGKDIDGVLVPDEEYSDAPKMPRKNAMDNFHKEARRLTKEGELVDVFVAAIPVYIDNEPLAGFGMYIDITDQKKYEEEIYSSLKEKHVLLQEIHHRVKNNLAVISGLIQLQLYETENPTIKDILKECESRIQTMALIHEKLYRSQNLSQIYCDTYIVDLVNTIRNTIGSEKDITVQTEIEDVSLNINQAVPFALLVNEVLTNSFKHAFRDRDQGSIKIILNEQDDQLQVRLSDNGVGLPGSVSLEESDTLGLTLIQKFLQQLDADWNMGSDNGTFLELSFVRDDMSGSSASRLLDL